MQAMFIKFLQAICAVKYISHMALYWFHVLSEKFLAIEHLLTSDCKLYEADIISFVCVFIFLQEHGVSGWLGPLGIDYTVLYPAFIVGISHSLKPHYYVQ